MNKTLSILAVILAVAAMACQNDSATRGQMDVDKAIEQANAITENATLQAETALSDANTLVNKSIEDARAQLGNTTSENADVQAKLNQANRQITDAQADANAMLQQSQQQLEAAKQ